MNNDKLQADLKQYGFGGLAKHFIKFFLRKIGITVNSYYYMVNHIDAEARRKQFEDAHLPSLKQLAYNDFLKGDERVFNEKKLKLIRNRLADNSYHAYGLIQDDNLLFSCWISLKNLESSDACINSSLDDNEGMLLDAYCIPETRGRGLQTAMCAYRLWQMVQNNKTIAISIVLKENKPSYKSLIKVGFEKAFTYYVATIWGKTLTNYFKKKKAYKENVDK